MSIQKIEIRNFKSLREIVINNTNSNSINCLLGKNGTGKSNLFEAIKFYFDNLENTKANSNLIDKHNMYVRFLEIRVQFNLNILFKKNSNEYLANDKAYLEKYTDENNNISLQLRLFKDGRIEWKPNDKKLNEIIRRMFPLYYIDTRSLDLSNWEYLWEMISDLSKTNLKIDRIEYEKMYNEFLAKAYGDKAKKTLNILTDNFNKADIKLNDTDYLEKFKLLLMSRLGGKEFLQNGYKLNYYSDGINSLNYLKLILSLIPQLANMGWKNPIILIDEIEIGLHPQYINELLKCVKDSIKSNYAVDLFVTTHSASFVAEIMKNNINTTLYRMNLTKNYSVIEKMYLKDDRVNDSLLTMREASYYFSDAIVIVEGITEIQLFTSSFIKNIYPKINKIEFVSYDSNNSRLEYLSPKNRKLTIPYLLVVDMDKIIKYKIKNKSFVLNSDSVNPLNSEVIRRKERLMYFSKSNLKKYYGLNYRQYIIKTLEKCSFEIDLQKLYMDDLLYTRLIGNLKEYCMQYSVYPASTTVEGLIINENNYEIFCDWFINTKNVDCNKMKKLLSVDENWSQSADSRYRTTILRLIFNGKLDTLEMLKNFGDSKLISGSVKSDIFELTSKAGSKANGWILEFVEYFFTNYIIKYDDEIKQKEVFKYHFPELSLLLNIIADMV